MCLSWVANEIRNIWDFCFFHSTFFGITTDLLSIYECKAFGTDFSRKKWYICQILFHFTQARIKSTANETHSGDDDIVNLTNAESDGNTHSQKNTFTRINDSIKCIWSVGITTGERNREGEKIKSMNPSWTSSIFVSFMQLLLSPIGEYGSSTGCLARGYLTPMNLFLVI